MRKIYLDSSAHKIIIKLSTHHEIAQIIKFLEGTLSLASQPPKTFSLELNDSSAEDFHILCQKLSTWQEEGKLSLENLTLHVAKFNDVNTSAQKNGHALAELIKIDGLQKISLHGACTSAQDLQSFFKPLIAELNQRKQNSLKMLYIHSQSFGVSPYSAIAQVIETGAVDEVILSSMNFLGKDSVGLHKLAEAILVTPDCQVQPEPMISSLDCCALKKIIKQKDQEKTENPVLKATPKKMLLSDEVKKITAEPVVKKQKSVEQVSSSLSHTV